MNNKFQFYVLIALIFNLLSCANNKSSNNEALLPKVKVVGAMKNVMWKGMLQASIELDTIKVQKGLYGLGPESYLTGELLILDGKKYVSRVADDSSLIVEESQGLSAPFFVYSNVSEWSSMDLPAEIKSIQELEKWLESAGIDLSAPFAFKLKGSIDSALIHAQNLAAGTKVRSPEEAHQGQVNYELGQSEVDIVGFYSQNHQGVFTHHDSYVHMHLITKDRSMMGHLDEVSFKKMNISVPKGIRSFSE